jgi:cell surface protein SprA
MTQILLMTTNLDVLAVNVQENNERCPINYVVPPGVQQEQLYNNTVLNQNEQSLALRVSGNGLEPEDSRAVLKKNVSIDMRQFNKLKMFFACGIIAK